MKTYNELVNEASDDTSFRTEFTSYLNLQIKLKDEEQKQSLESNSESDNTEIIHRYKRNISFLYTALVKGLSTNYKLDADTTRILILDVSDKYKNL